MGLVWILSAIVGLIVVIGVFQFNRIVQMRQMTRNAWADVDVFLKRRAELVPNLVATVQAYAQHEETTLLNLSKARSDALGAGRISERAEAEQAVGVGVRGALLLVENYPDLKASESFRTLQIQLADTEDKIAKSRQYYNACVRDFNTLIESFPASLLAGMSGAQAAEYFEIEVAQERQAISVSGLRNS
jgi:LemA protein